MIQYGGGPVLTCCEDFLGAVLEKKQLFDWEPIHATCETEMIAKLKLDG